jgi:REP element-mobilizing transposase RayT
MSDHVHLLTEATVNKSLVDIIRELKGLWTKEAWKHGFSGAILQKSFFDHFLRKDENTLTVVRYIFNNPVRAGIVVHWEDYPYLGSTIFTGEDLKGGG